MKLFLKQLSEWSGIFLLLFLFASDLINNVNAGDLGGAPKADVQKVGEQEGSVMDEGRSVDAVSPGQRPEASIADQVEQLDPNFKGDRRPIGLSGVDRSAKTELRFTPLDEENEDGEALYRVDHASGDAYSHLKEGSAYTIQQMQPQKAKQSAHN